MLFNTREKLSRPRAPSCEVPYIPIYILKAGFWWESSRWGWGW